MRFWDSSAVVPLIVEEASSRNCRGLIRRDPRTMVWCLTRTEVLAACWRRQRAGAMSDQDVWRATHRLDLLSERWSEVTALELVRAEAERLLGVHALRAADALQLAAAVIWTDHQPRRRSFVCLDANLLLAALREGFDAIRPS